MTLWLRRWRMRESTRSARAVFLGMDSGALGFEVADYDRNGSETQRFYRTRKGRRIQAEALGCWCVDPSDGCLRDADFRVGSVHLPQGVADFADGGVGADGIEDEGHGVGVRDVAVRFSLWLLGCGFLQRLEASLNFFVGAALAKRPQFCGLVASDGFVDIKNLRRFFFNHEIVYTDDNFLVGLSGSLELISRLGNFLLRITALDRLHHSAHRVHLVEVVEGASFHIESEALHKIGATERIDGLRYP